MSKAQGLGVLMSKIETIQSLLSMGMIVVSHDEEIVLLNGRSKMKVFYRIGSFRETGLYGEDIDIVDRCKSYNLRKVLTRQSTYIYHREPHDELTNIG